MISYIYVLRLIHVFSAIFWVGTTFFLLLFLEPALDALGPAGSKVMQKLAGGTRFSLAMGLVGWSTVLSGLLMYAEYTGFDATVMFSNRLPLTLGAVCGILAGFTGTLIQGRASGKLVALGRRMASQAGPPSQQQLATIGVLQATIRRGSHITAGLAVLAVIGMTA